METGVAIAKETERLAKAKGNKQKNVVFAEAKESYTAECCSPTQEEVRCSECHFQGKATNMWSPLSERFNLAKSKKGKFSRLVFYLGGGLLMVLFSSVGISQIYKKLHLLLYS